MTQIATASATAGRRWEQPPVAGVLAFAAATAVVAVAIFGPQRQDDQVGVLPALVVFAGIATALVFALVVRRAASGGTSPRRVAVIGALALGANALFWTGLPAVLGVATLALRPHAPASRGRTAGTALAVIALAANVTGALVG